MKELEPSAAQIVRTMGVGRQDSLLAGAGLAGWGRRKHGLHISEEERKIFLSYLLSQCIR